MRPSFFEELKQHTLTTLENALPASLTYHHAGHTADVLKQAERIAVEEGLASEHDLLLLKVAALYHDTGFLYTYRDHERRSCEIAREELNAYFSGEEINAICDMIMATKLPQTPLSYLGEIICDADLDYLGRDDFPGISDGLRLEFLHFGIVKDNRDWEEKQIAFLKNHSYFTGNSRQLRESVKQQHIGRLEEIFLNGNV